MLRHTVKKLKSLWEGSKAPSSPSSGELSATSHATEPYWKWDFQLPSGPWQGKPTGEGFPCPGWRFISEIKDCSCFMPLRLGALYHLAMKLPWWLGGKESSCQCRSFRFGPWVTKILWRRKWHHCSILAWRIPWKRSLVGYSPWGHTRVRHNLATKQQPRLNQPFWFSFVPGPGCWVLFNFANFWGIYSYLN